MPASISLAELRVEQLDTGDHHLTARAARTGLVVEDDASMRQSLAAALSPDFRVRTAGSGAFLVTSPLVLV